MKFSRRVMRAISTIPNGVEYLEFLQRPEIITLMRDSVYDREPAVAYISTKLIENFGKEAILNNALLRQTIGLIVKEVMLENGFKVVENGVRITDPLFKSGSVYEEIDEEDEDDLAGQRLIITAMVEGLTHSQLLRLREIIDNALEANEA